MPDEIWGDINTLSGELFCRRNNTSLIDLDEEAGTMGMKSLIPPPAGEQSVSRASTQQTRQPRKRRIEFYEQTPWNKERWASNVVRVDSSRKATTEGDLLSIADAVQIPSQPAISSPASLQLTHLNIHADDLMSFGDDTVHVSLQPQAGPSTDVPTRPSLGQESVEIEEDEEHEGIVDRLENPEVHDTRLLRRTMRQTKPSKLKKKPKDISKDGVQLPMPETPVVPQRNQQSSMFNERQQAVKEPTSESDKQAGNNRNSNQETNTAGQSRKPSSKDLALALEHGRAFKGDLRMEVQFGQILLHGFKIGRGAMDTDDFVSQLKEQETARSALVHFIPRLTTTYSDMDFIHNLLDANGQRMFNVVPAQAVVYYELVGYDAEKRKMSVTIDANRDVVARFADETIGEIYMHYPKRSWDARITVTGTHSEKNIFPTGKDQESRGASKSMAKHDAFSKLLPRNKALPETMNGMAGFFSDNDGLKEILDTLSAEIRGTADSGGQYPVLQWRSTLKGFHVEQVFVKRRFQYQCTMHAKLLLELTQVQDLQKGVSTKIAGLEQAAAKTPADMIKLQRLWYEASVITQPIEAFEENRTLELGDEASWTPEQVLADGTLEALQKMAGRVVTRIDNVGFYNEGPISKEIIDEVRQALREAKRNRIEEQGGFW